MADRIGKFGAIERVKVDVADPARVKAAAQLGGDGCGDQLAGLGVVVESFEHGIHPRRDGRAALRGKLARLGDVGDG